ncbi:MAG: lamin tail domain-containing protein [Bacteroidia bacterium]|nr:lamin tail domain-containing protein [Bacteroidia bacterium]
MRQSNLLVQLLLAATLLFLGQGLNAQTTIYSEDFESTNLQEGLTGILNGNQNFTSTNGKWNLTLSPSGLNGTTDWVRVENDAASFGGFPGGTFSGGSQFLQFRDVDEPVVFQTQPIDISSYTTANISVDVFELGLFETTGDFFEVSIIVDGARTVVQTLNDDFSDTNSPVGSSSSSSQGNTNPLVSTITEMGITGNTLIVEIRCDNNSGSEYYNLDKVEVVGMGFVAPSCTFSFGANSATCDAVTPGNDTYTATFNFSGAGNGTYTVNSNAGTVVLDNDPSSAASGAFRVTGIPEGTDVTATVNGVSCVNLVSTVTSPNCNPTPSIVINEIMYNPPEAGTDTSEYVELLNNSGFAVDLSGWSFADGISFTFPANTVLADGEYFVIAVDADAFQNKYGFAADGDFSGGLSNGGEDIVLVDNNGVTQDSVDYEDDTRGFDSNADGTGRSLELLDPASDNNLGASWAASIDANGTPGSLNQTGCALAITVNSPTCDSETIGATSDTYTVTIDFSGAGNDTYTITPNAGNLAAASDNPTNVATGTLIIENVQEGTDLSFSITSVNGCNVPVAVTSPSCEPAAPLPSIVITEIMYNGLEPGADTTEYVELFNNGSAAVDLSGFTFTQGFVFTFPANSIIGVNEYIVVAGNASGFENFYGCTADYEWTTGGLSNGGEDIILEDLNGNVLDVVDYDDGSGWPTSPDGTGPSLELVDVNSDNNLAASWEASEGRGTPGAANTGSIGDCPPVAPVLSLDASILYFPTLNWDAQNFATYEIRRQINGGGYTTIATLGSDETSFTDTLLVFGLPVDYRVMAVNVNGNVASNTVSLTQLAVVERLELQFSCYDPSTDELTWTVINPNNVTVPYIFAQWWSAQRDTLLAPTGNSEFTTLNNPQDPSTVGDDNITGIWWIDETLQAGEPNDLVFSIDLANTCAVGRVANPSPQAPAGLMKAKAITALFATTNITEQSIAAQIKIGPNPFNNTLFVETEELKGTSTVSLFDMMGKKVFETEVYLGSRTEITVPNLNKGVYMMQIGSAQGSFNTKVVKK